jgi:pyridoxine 5-phosphate synthase
MIRLGVNIDHVATVRQARKAKEPDPVTAAALALFGGADGITIHLREDRRHIQDRDVVILRQTVPSGLNLEMACSDEIIKIAATVRPDQVTLVPEKREELTTEGGLDVISHRKTVAETIKRLNAANIEVALFIDPVREQVEISKELGAVAIEFQTGSYAEAITRPAIKKTLEALQSQATIAKKLGLQVHMGHGLNYLNVIPIARIPEVEELNIGHSIISRSMFVGIEQAVREMKEVLHRVRVEHN